MAVETPAHGERRGAADPLHGFHPAVARRADHPRGAGVGLVAEKDVGWEGVDARPGNGLSQLPIAAQLPDLRRVGDDDAVARHAELRAWHPGEGGALGGAVAES